MPLPPTVAVAVIGAGQAGLSAAYFLQRFGVPPHEADGYLVLDHNPSPGGAWQHRWPSLTLSTVNGVHDLPGLSFAEALDLDPQSSPDVQAARAVPGYFAAYEERFGLPVHRPVSVGLVRHAERDDPRRGRFVVQTDRGELHAAGVINATGTWERPFWPLYPGADTFRGRQLHAADYRTAKEFRGQHVVVVGGGISAVQLLEEVSHVATTTWVTRREPVWVDEPFTPDRGRAAVALVEERVRAGLPPLSVVSVTGLLMTPRLAAARARGVLDRQPMFSQVRPEGVAWPDGRIVEADVILWCTGFRSALDHLAPLRLRGPGGGIRMDGRMATRVAAEHRLHLLGYGPTASTIGANRGGRAAVTELLTELGQRVRRDN
jgi:hypothetical protein